MLAAIDYVRLGSWWPNSYTDLMSELMERHVGKWYHFKWLQYKGWRRDEIFAGVGEQRGKRHTITHCSGYAANDYAEYLRKRRHFYCSRLDLQATILKPDDVSLPELHDKLGKQNSTLISSESNDTLYIGRRTSDIFTRLYEKPIGKQMFLRLEFELKGSRSRAAWVAYNQGESATGLFNYYKAKSMLPMAVKQYFELSDDHVTEYAMREEIINGANKTLEWLRSIDDAVIKALHNHQIGLEVSHLVKSWAGIASNLDRMMEEE